MTNQEKIIALAKLDGFRFVKVVGEPEQTHWQLSDKHNKDGTLSAGTPWAVSYIVRDNPDDGDSIVDLRLTKPYLTSYDAIIPLIHKTIDLDADMSYNSIRFYRTLVDATMKDSDEELDCLEEFSDLDLQRCIRATPEELADVLLKAKGLWT